MAKSNEPGPPDEKQKPAEKSAPPGPSAPPPSAAPSGSPLLRWFFSKSVRQATAMRKHVQKLLNHQRDLLSAKAVEEVEAAMREIDAAVAANAGRDVLEKKMANLETTANKWLKPYPHASYREN